MTSARIYPNVRLGRDVVLDDWVILGRPPKDAADGELPLEIGDASVFRSHTVVYAGSRIGRRLQTGHAVLIRERCTIGDDCSVGSGSILEFAVVVGNCVRIHSGVFVPEHCVLGDGCWLGPRVVLTNAKFPGSPRAKDLLRGVRVGCDARVGANATVLPGVVLGEGCLVGAGSVVTRDVPAGAVVTGNPARVVGSVSALREPDSGRPPYSR